MPSPRIVTSAAERGKVSVQALSRRTAKSLPFEEHCRFCDCSGVVLMMEESYNFKQGELTMRYMMLIYNRNTENGKPLAEQTTCTEESTAAHWAIVDETNRRGIFCGAEPLEPTAAATTIRAQNGKVVMTDG